MTPPRRAPAPDDGAKGCALAMLYSAPLWVLIGILLWFLLK